MEKHIGAMLLAALLLCGALRAQEAQPLGGTDLNTVISSGRYIQVNSGYSTASLNYPAIGVQGVLTVMGLGNDFTSPDGTRFQTFETSGNRVFARYSYGGNWNPWAEVAAANLTASLGATRTHRGSAASS